MPEFFTEIDTNRSFEEACVDAKLSLFAEGVALSEANLLAYYPRSGRNPFQSMLYSAALENGFACFSAPSLEAIRDPVVDAPLFMHYHWVHRLFERAETTRDAAKATADFHQHIDL